MNISEQLRSSATSNDPNGRVHFYFNIKKKKTYIKIHLDRKSTIDRKATEQDKIEYPDQWDDFHKKRKVK
jgi:hypothetical protein